MEHRPEEQAVLRTAALRALGHPEELAPRIPTRPLLLLSHSPALSGPCRSWSVFEPHGDTPALLRRVTWDCVEDGYRLSDPLVGLRLGFHTRPTITLADAELSGPEMEVIRRGLAALRVPLALQDAPWGLDGESFGLTLAPGGFHSVELRWWLSGPPAWREIVEWASHTRERLESLTGRG